MDTFKQKILALDFDGVVWDSVGECFQVARKTYQKLFGVDCTKLEQPFRAGRWLVRCGGDFYVVMKLALEQPDRDWQNFSKDEFARMEQEDPQAKRFETEFYAYRKQWQHDDPDGWAASQRAYPGFVAQFGDLKAAFREVVLTTTKDQQSATLLLATAGIQLAIWGREHGTHKGEQITDLCKQRSIEAGQVVFIDDLLDNCKQVAPTGAHAFLAAWGYNTPNEQRAAEHAGYSVLQQDKLLDQLGSAFAL